MTLNKLRNAEPRSRTLVPPYPPSWIDRFTAWLERRPWPVWVSYLALGILSVAFFAWDQARAGAYVGGFVPFHLFLALQTVACLGLMHHIDHLAGESLQRFSPAIPKRTAEVARASYRLTNLPPLLATLGGIAGTALTTGYLLQGQAGAEEMRVAFTPVFSAYVLLMGWVYGTLFAFVIHEVRAIRALYAQASRVDIFHPDALYAFSPLAARTAIGLAVITFGWSVGQPTNFSDPLSLINGLFTLGLAILVFVSPLWGAHRMLVDAKRNALSENASRFSAAALDVHRRLDAGRTSGMDGLNRAMANLDLERAHLARATTWPWQPETFRGVVGTVALPIMIWLIQFGLQRILG